MSNRFIDWKEIDTVLLDMDGTLLDLHFDSYFWLEHVPDRYAQKNRISKEQAKELLIPQMRENMGKLEWYCLDFWSEKLELDIPCLKTECQDKIAVRPHVITFLKKLKAHKKRVILVTNAHRKSLVLKMRKTGLDKWFDAIVSSHDYGVAKEQQQFWERLVHWHSVEAQRSVLIDDSAAVLRSAQKFGIAVQLGIYQPDSKMPPINPHEFERIESFLDLLPIKTPLTPLRGRGG